jgi:hypothetical protein
MKAIFFLLSLSVAIISCDDDKVVPPNIEVNESEVFDVIEFQKIIYSNVTSNDLELKVTKILDNRCPANAQCIWLGNATVSVEVLDENTVVDILEFCLGDCNMYQKSSTNFPDTVNFSYKSANYGAILLEVSPFPTTDNGDKAKHAKMKLITQ